MNSVKITGNESEPRFRFRVNVLHRGKERWKYCGTIERATFLQQSAIKAGLSSIIFERMPDRWRVVK